MEETASNSFAL